MQAAIDRVLRSLSFKPAAVFADDTQARMTRDDVATLATRLLDNYKADLAQRVQKH